MTDPAPINAAAPDPPGVHSGAHIALRLFDVAYAIDLAQAEALWANHAGGSRWRTGLVATLPKALSFEVAPLQFPLGAVEVDIDGTACSCAATATVYDFGVIAFSLRAEVGPVPWSDYARGFHALDAAVGGDVPDAPVWTQLLDRVCSVIGAAFERPARRGVLQEDYLYAVVHALQEPLDAEQIQRRIDIPALLSGEARPLSAGERGELMHRAFSYYADDLVVLTWDRAFVLEPRRDPDVIGIVEVANAQLVQMRWYDELLDDELPIMYDLVEHSRGGLLAPHRAARLARKLYTLVAEVTELTERVDNALQVTEDVYLARVYGSALELFRVPRLGAAVDRKLGIIRDTYTALYDEASSRRTELLEVAIVLLIVFEIVLALVRY